MIRYDDIEARLENPPEPVMVNGDFPSDRLHGWKYIKFGLDGKLYVPVGMPCNVCNLEEEDERYGTIMRMGSDGALQIHQREQSSLKNLRSVKILMIIPHIQ